MDHLDGKVAHKYNHHDVQNELLNIMGAYVLREKFATIRDPKFFSIMADEGTDLSNLEQLSFCARTVDDDLNVDEDFLGFYEINNIKSETVVKAIEDILIRCSLSLDDCRGETYDGSSNIMGKHSGVSTKISEEQPKTIATHCQHIVNTLQHIVNTLQHIANTLPRLFVEFSGEIFDQRMSYSARHYGDSWGNLRLKEVFSETRKKCSAS